MRPVLLAAFLHFAVLIAGCTPPKQAAAQVPAPTVAPSMPVELPGLNAAVLEARSAIQDFAPTVSPSLPASPQGDDSEFTACAVKLITRWEVGSPALYARKWAGVYYPGGISGPTFGIGYDGGHNTKNEILRVWEQHAQKYLLAQTSGVTGEEAKRRIKEWRMATVPYTYAAQVFITDSLPVYTASARRALGPGFVSLPATTRCALVSLGYNRGWATTGPRRAETRIIRDKCMDMPSTGDARMCVATQIRAMKRLWPDTPGLQARREDEARVALL